MLTTAILNEKRIVFSETFRSPAVFDNKAEALKVLDNIRESHPSSLGWIEIDSYVAQATSGKWYAVRDHVRCK